jgi:peptidylprolyl isomerase
LENECKAPAVETPSGLKFIDCKPGNGAFPMGEDTVEVNYVGTLANGAEFDSSKSRGPGPYSLKVEKTIRGLREGLQKMRENGRMILVVPPELGFGNDGVPGKVPPGATLFFDVELVSVKPAH